MFRKESRQAKEYHISQSHPAFINIRTDQLTLGLRIGVLKIWNAGNCPTFFLHKKVGKAVHHISVNPIRGRPERWYFFLISTVFNKDTLKSYLRTAGSRISGLLVAAMTKTPFLPSTPSISVRSWLTTLLEAPPSPPGPAERLGHSESNSSKNMTHGAEFLALTKHARTALSLSPTYMLSSSGPLKGWERLKQVLIFSFDSHVWQNDTKNIQLR